MIIKKVLLKKDAYSVEEIAKANNIGYSTLKRWVKDYQDNIEYKKKYTNNKSAEMSLLVRFNHLMATSSLGDVEIGVYCRENGIFNFQLKQWKEEFMTQHPNQIQLKFQSELKALRIENKQLKQNLRRKDSALAETAALLILQKKNSINLGGQRGKLTIVTERYKIIDLIKTACQSGAHKHKACAILGISLRTFERWTKTDCTEDKRQTTKRIPVNKLTKEQRETVIITANNITYRDLPPCKIVPLLADKGQYIASESTFYRILKSENQMQHRQKSRPIKHNKPDAYIAYGSNQVWTWDISYLPTQVVGLYYYLYVIVDIYSRKIVGFGVYEQELSELAANLITQTYLDERVLPNQIVLHSDNGSPMKGATMLATLKKLGVVPSFSRPSVSNDNPYSEALFKTIKYHPAFPMIEKFANITIARNWCEKFVTWYNNDHLHSALKFITPQQRHNGLCNNIMIKRLAVYQLAQKQNPERWSKNIRNWILPNIVTLNPDKKK